MVWTEHAEFIRDLLVQFLASPDDFQRCQPPFFELSTRAF